MKQKPIPYRVVMPDGTIHTCRALGASEPAAYWPLAARIERMDVKQPPIIEDSNDG